MYYATVEIWPCHKINDKPKSSGLTFWIRLEAIEVKLSAQLPIGL